MNLDFVLLIMSIVFTILLAAIGIEMANNPPTSRKKRWIYRSIFILLGSFLIGVTYWQGRRNIEEQADTKASAAKQRQMLQTQSDQVQGKLDTIQNFVEHPPVGLTQTQIAAAVHTMSLPACVEDTLRPYKCTSNAELGQWIIDESSKLTDMQSKSLNKINGLRKAQLDAPKDMRDLKDMEIRGEYAFFAMNMQKCCVDEMKNMRKEALDRLGPAGEDLEEQRRWQIMQPMPTYNFSPGIIRDYAPYLLKMGQQLRELKQP